MILLLPSFLQEYLVDPNPIRLAPNPSLGRPWGPTPTGAITFLTPSTVTSSWKSIENPNILKTATG